MHVELLRVWPTRSVPRHDVATPLDLPALRLVHPVKISLPNISVVRLRLCTRPRIGGSGPTCRSRRLR